MILPDALAGARLFQQTKKKYRGSPRRPSFPLAPPPGGGFKHRPHGVRHAVVRRNIPRPAHPGQYPDAFFFQKKTTFFPRRARHAPPTAVLRRTAAPPRHHVEAEHAPRRGRRSKGGTPRDPGRFLVSPPRGRPSRAMGRRSTPARNRQAAPRHVFLGIPGRNSTGIKLHGPRKTSRDPMRAGRAFRG